VCVGLSSAPKGKWFCPSCVESKKKKKEKLTISSMSSGVNASISSTFISLNTPTTSSSSFTPTSGFTKQTSESHQTNPFLSSSSSFSINFNDKNF